MAARDWAAAAAEERGQTAVLLATEVEGGGVGGSGGVAGDDELMVAAMLSVSDRTKPEAGSVIASRVSDITCTPATSAMRCSYATASQPAHSARSEARARARFSFNRSSMNRAPLPTSA